MTDRAPILAATAANFDALVLGNSQRGPVLVDFWAPYAGPSLRQAELLRRLAREYHGRFLLVTVNTSAETALTHRFGVRSLPSCKLFVRGHVVEQLHGMRTEAEYRALLERHLLPLADKVQAAALKAWQAGAHDEALQVLAEGAMAVPDDPAIPRLMAKLLVQLGRHGDALGLLEALPPKLAEDRELRRLRAHLRLIDAAAPSRAETDAAPEQTEAELAAALARDPDDHARRIALAARRLLADDVDGALAGLAELHSRATGWRSDAALQAVQAIADVVGPDDPRLARFRRQLFDH